ncbi:MAG: LysR family transcriptional regulator [Deltaproteobacteria bacterium]|nr:LysR family transcriptional regulator [Deltaproteobacteria bacterium]
MSEPRFRVPSTSALVAFEATARLGGVIRASEELLTSQSAVSRHIRNLETRIGEKLFRRQGRGVVLTPSGQDYYVAVKAALENLHAASKGLGVQTPSVTIACTKEVANFLLRPSIPQVKRAMDDNADVRVLTCDYDMLQFLAPTGIDVLFEYAAAPSEPAAVKVLDEEIVPVASPTLVRRFERALGRHPRHWADIPRLEAIQNGETWATWTTWFSAHDCDPPKAPTETLDDYQELLDAAASGLGMAIGWNGFVSAYLDSGRLVRLRDNWLRTHIGLYAVPTQASSGNRNAAVCLSTLAALGEVLPGARQLSPQRQPNRGDGAFLERI